jgi:Ni,Fe-hydrogenase III small subunit
MEAKDMQPAQTTGRPSNTAGRHALPVMQPGDQELAQASEALRRRIDRLFGRSLHIRHVDAGSCNACESEIKLLTSPYYDLHRLGLFFTPAPRHADLLLVTGPITRAMEGPLLRTYEAMPDPRLVVAVGACPCSGGVFGPGPYVRGSLQEVLPVDVFIPGCPPSPLALIHGLLLAINRTEQRLHSGPWTTNPGMDAHGAIHREHGVSRTGATATTSSSGTLEEQR